MEAEKHLREQEQLYLRTVESLALAVDAKDQTTYGHIRRVRAYAMGLAKLCGIKDPNELMAIETGSLLHDIGKLAIDDYILNKPGRLTTQEFEKMKVHAAAGDEILQQICFPFPVAQYVRCHHERWDGLGYPDGLKGEAIPLGARILAVADAFDAIRYSRPYKLSFDINDAIDILRRQAGTVYDPNLVELFISHIKELEEAAEIASENAPNLSFRKHFEKIEQAFPKAITPISHGAASRDTNAEFIQLAEFCDTVGKHLYLSDVLPILCQRIGQLVPFSTCVFYLDNGDDSVKTAYAIGDCSEALQDHSMGLGKGISGWVAAYKQPMINTNPALDFKDAKWDVAAFADALVVPMLFEDQCLGAISLYARPPISYTQNHLSILQTFASLIAPLINESEKRKASERHLIDPTTQTYRIACLSTIGPEMITAAAENQTPLSILYIGIMNFPQIVNLYGSNMGNSVLKRVAESLKSELRETDILMRYGYQGFTALLPGVRTEQALRCAQRLQQQIRNKPAIGAMGHKISINCRAGIATYPQDGSTVFALLQFAQESAAAITPKDDATEGNILEFLPRY